MSDDGRRVADVEGAYALVDGAVFVGDARVLAHVLGPGLDEEGFKVATGARRVGEETPARRPVAPCDALRVLHRACELEGALGVYQVLDRHQHGAALRPRLVDEGR